MRYKAASLGIVTLAMFLAASCSGTSSTDSIGLVPQAADFVAHISVSQILNDSDLVQIYDALPKDPDDPQTFEAALADMKAETGIDLNVFDEMFIFGDAATSRDDIDYMGVIGRGTFDTVGLISDIEDAADLDLLPTTYKDYEMYADAEAGAAIAFLGAETVVIGTADAVTDVIDVKVGDAPSIGGEVMGIFDGLGNVLAKLAASAEAAATEKALQGATGDLPVPVDLSPLVDVETAGFTFARVGQSIDVEIELNFSNSNSARDAKGLVSMVKAMVNTYGVPEEGPGGMPIREEGQVLIPQVLAELESKVVDSDLAISLTMTFEEIEKMLSEEAAP